MTITILTYTVFTGLSVFSTGVWDFNVFRFLCGLGVGGQCHEVRLYQTTDDAWGAVLHCDFDPDLPMRETVLIRLLRLCFSGMGDFFSPEFRRIRWIEVEPPRLREAYQARFWEGPLEPIFAQLPQRFGTPRFLVVQNGQIIDNQLGVSSWLRVLSEVKTLIA